MAAERSYPLSPWQSLSDISHPLEKPVPVEPRRPKCCDAPLLSGPPTSSWCGRYGLWRLGSSIPLQQGLAFGQCTSDSADISSQSKPGQR